MKRKDWLIAFSLALPALILTGCSSMPWMPGGSQTTALPANHAARAPTAGQSVSSAFKSVGTTVADTLTVQSKTVPAEDPVRLSTQPGKLEAEVHYRAATFAERTGNEQAAQDQYEQALAKDPAHVKTLLAYARHHDRRERFDDALALYERARIAAPQNATVWNDYGLCLARKEQMPAAIAAFSQAINLEPKNARYRNNMATTLVHVGRTEEAVQHLSAVHPPAVALYNTSLLLRQNGRLQESIAVAQRAAQIDPAFQPARDVLAELTGDGNNTPARLTAGSGADEAQRPANGSAGDWNSQRESNWSPSDTTRGQGATGWSADPRSASAARRLPTTR